MPTYDLLGRDVVGISGRSEVGATPKWLHSKGFSSGQHLYGVWLTQENVQKTRTIVLTEGPCDVWRLYEAGIENCAALYGGNLTPSKHVLLDRLGVMNIILMLDNDKAGTEYAERISHEYSHLYNIRMVKLPPPAKDVGEMTIDQIKRLNLENVYA